jgi:hypothetical protein
VTPKLCLLVLVVVVLAVCAFGMWVGSLVEISN